MGPGVGRAAGVMSGGAGEAVLGQGGVHVDEAEDTQWGPPWRGEHAVGRAGVLSGLVLVTREDGTAPGGQGWKLGEAGRGLQTPAFVMGRLSGGVRVRGAAVPSEDTVGPALPTSECQRTLGELGRPGRVGARRLQAQSFGSCRMRVSQRLDGVAPHLSPVPSRSVLLLHPLSHLCRPLPPPGPA